MPRKKDITPRREIDKSDTPWRPSGEGVCFIVWGFAWGVRVHSWARRMSSAAALSLLSQALGQTRWQRHRSYWSLTDPSLSIPGLMFCGMLLLWLNQNRISASPPSPSGWMSSEVLGSLRWWESQSGSRRTKSFVCLCVRIILREGERKVSEEKIGLDCDWVTFDSAPHHLTGAGQSCKNIH